MWTVSEEPLPARRRCMLSRRRVLFHAQRGRRLCAPEGRRLRGHRHAADQGRSRGGARDVRRHALRRGLSKLRRRERDDMQGARLRARRRVRVHLDPERRKRLRVLTRELRGNRLLRARQLAGGWHAVPMQSDQLRRNTRGLFVRARHRHASEAFPVRGASVLRESHRPRSVLLPAHVLREREERTELLCDGNGSGHRLPEGPARRGERLQPPDSLIRERATAGADSGRFLRGPSCRCHRRHSGT